MSKDEHELGGSHTSSTGRTYWIRGTDDVEDVTVPGPCTWNRWGPIEVGKQSQIEIIVPPNYDKDEVPVTLKLEGGKAEKLTLGG